MLCLGQRLSLRVKGRWQHITEITDSPEQVADGTIRSRRAFWASGALVSSHAYSRAFARDPLSHQEQVAEEPEVKVFGAWS